MKLCSINYDCRFFLATGKKEEEQKILNEILQSEFQNRCVALHKLDLIDILPIVRNCKISVCNDSSFSHLSAAVGIQTIVLMADTPMLYGSYSPSMHPIIPDGESSVTHDTLGKDKINPDKIFSSIYAGLANPAYVGRNIFGDKWYSYHVSQLATGDNLLVVLGSGLYSWKKNTNTF